MAKFDASWQARIGFRERDREVDTEPPDPPTIEEFVDAAQTGLAAVFGDDFEVTVTAERLDI